MRARPIALLSTVAAATLILAGCAGSGDPGASPTPSSSDASACVVNAKPGAGSDAVKVDGAGLGAKVSVPAGTEFADLQRTVITEGDGKEVRPGDFVSATYQIVDAATGKVMETSERGPGGVLPVLLSTSTQGQITDSTQSPIFTAAMECQPLGSEIVLALPGQNGQNPVVLYVQTLEELPKTANGAETEAPKGMATVKIAKDGSPTITIPDAEAPTKTTIGLLRKGDGATVAPGDLVTVQYRGVKWSDGKEFDSSWSRSFPSQFPTSGVVAGFRQALEGQQVGSQVIAEIPPADGYGGQPGHELEKETLVFVVDILGTTPTVQ